MAFVDEMAFVVLRASLLAPSRLLSGLLVVMAFDLTILMERRVGGC